METVSGQPTPSVRIEVSHLDSMMNLAGELVLCRNQLLQAIASDDRRLLEITGQRIDLATSEIQEQIMRTRMQPISVLFDRLPSVVEDLSRHSGKAVDLLIAGRDVDIDKTILEAIESPVRQLIENAVNHGIEPPGIRQKHNKSVKGSIHVSACHEAGQVVIDIADDGVGIDLDRLVRRAVDKGLIADTKSPEVANEAEKMKVVFLPGLIDETETDDSCLQLADLDVIKVDLEKVGGTINAGAREEGGKRIRIKLPLTLSIIPSQIVQLENERFAIPQVNLSELLRVPAGQVKQMIETVGDADVIRLRGELLPVIDLAKTLGLRRSFVHPENGQRQPERRLSLADRRSRDHSILKEDYSGPERRDETDRRSHPNSAMNIAIVSTGTFKYGLVVDTMNDSEEIVVKPLGKHLKACRGFAGATIMGDGKVALILDVVSIGEIASLHENVSKVSGKSFSEGSIVKETENTTSYLFFSNAESERLAIPLDKVARIEKIDAADIEVVGGSRVLKYRGGSLPLIALHEGIQAAPLPEIDHYQVICFNVDDREVGLLATPPVDAVEVTIELDEKTLKQPGVLGSAVLMDRTTLILDTEQIVRITKPEFFH